MQFHDTIALDGVRITGDGYLAANAKVARTGIQIYSGAEVGKPDMASVRVLRPADEVFSKDALHSFAFRPVTIGHPTQPVNATNWRDHSVGILGGEILRDGEAVSVPILLMDAAAIKAVQDGKAAQNSMGYTCDLAWEAGVTPDGQEYDAVQRNIRANHLALVSVARGGPALKIGDDKSGEGKDDMTTTTRKITFDGIEIEVTDQAAQAIAKLQTSLTDANTKIGTLTGELSTAKTAIETKDGEIVGLKKQLEDAKPTPEQIDSLVAERTSVIDAAKRVMGDKASTLVTDGKTVAEIRKQAVTAKLGDEGTKDMADAAIEGAFRALTPAKGSGSSSTASPANPTAAVVGDASAPKGPLTADQAREARDRELTSAWRGSKAA